MVMAERYGIPSTKIIGLMSSWQVPFRNVQKGDRLLVLTDAKAGDGTKLDFYRR